MPTSKEREDSIIAQSKEGARKARQKLIEKHGGEEGYRAYLSAIGRKGGETKGKSKVRGDKDYYKKIGKKGTEKRWNGSGK